MKPERGHVFEGHNGRRFYVLDGPREFSSDFKDKYTEPMVSVIEVEGQFAGTKYRLPERHFGDGLKLVDAPRRAEDAEAFALLADIAYGSPDAIWTSPVVLVETVLRKLGIRA